MRVFLTGGTGLLGSHTAELLRREGHEVVALRRRSSDTTFLEELGCELAEGDVRDDPATLAASMGGCTHLVHGAALVYSGQAWPRVRAVNVEGTRSILEAAAQAGIRGVVHLSSVAVYGTVEGGVEVDEERSTDTPIPAGDLYARSKREAEAEARAVEGREGIPVTVLRPSAIYGERDRLLSPRLGAMVRRPLTFLLGPGHNHLPVVYAGNVADAVRLALEQGRAGVTWDVGLDHPVTQRRLLEGVAEGMGRSPTFVSLPGALALGAAGLLERLGVSAPGAQHLPLGRVVRLALGENPYPSRTIRRESGWNPPVPLDDALRRTGRWLRVRT